MPYDFGFTPLILSPFGQTSMQAQLVQGIAQVTPGDKIVITEDVAENQTFSSPWPGGVAFTLGPGPDPPASRVGIRLARQAPGIVGPLYRSGFLGALPAAASGIPQLEIVEAPWHTVTEPEINQSVQMMLPFTRDGVTINTASMVINEGTVTVKATGTAPAAVLGTINFTVEGPFHVAPASQMSDISRGPQDAVEFSVAAIPSVELQGSGPSIPEAEAIIKILQAFSGSTVGPVMASALNTSVNSALPTAIGSALGKIGGPATLPSSITASVERVIVGTWSSTPNETPTLGIHILGALGSFSGVVSTLFPAVASGGKTGCSKLPVLALVIAGGGALAQAVLRSRRRT